MKKLGFFLVVGLTGVACYFLASYSGSAETIPWHIVSIRTFVNFVTAMVVLIAFVTFATDYIPAVRVIEARHNEGKNLVYYKIKNYSKTLIKNMIIHHTLFDVTIKDGTSCNEDQIHLFLYNSSQEKMYVGPVSEQEFVLNLNRVKTDALRPKGVTLDAFTHHLFLLVTIKFGFWFWPFSNFRIRGVLGYDKENDLWFSGSEEHPELKGLFKKIFSLLENDDEKSLKQILEGSNQRAKQSWGALYSEADKTKPVEVNR